MTTLTDLTYISFSLLLVCKSEYQSLTPTYTAISYLQSLVYINWGGATLRIRNSHTEVYILTGHHFGSKLSSNCMKDRPPCNCLEPVLTGYIHSYPDYSNGCKTFSVHPYILHITSKKDTNSYMY